MIEVLVVIGIIAILMGILFPVVSSSLNKASKTRAQNDMMHIVAAVRAYYGDYGKFPVPQGDNGSADKTYAGKGAANSEQNEVMNMLRGIDTTNNRYARVYLEADQDSFAGTDMDGNDYVVADGYYLDPWGNPYLVAMDTDFNGDSRLTNLKSPPAPSTTLVASGKVAAVISYGDNPGRTNSLLSSAGFN